MDTDMRINTYIEKAPEAFQSMLDEIRQLVHEFCPQVEETMKWQCPFFMYKGKILCNMAAFKKHCSFGFWLAPLMNSSHFSTGAMGDFGKMTQLSDLPSREIFKTMVQEAMELIDAGKTITKATHANVPLEIPQEISDFLAKDELVKTNFESFSKSQQKEYIEWIQEAKTEATRTKRLNTMQEWVAEGKPRQWKYMKK